MVEVHRGSEHLEIPPVSRYADALFLRRPLPCSFQRLARPPRDVVAAGRALDRGNRFVAPELQQLRHVGEHLVVPGDGAGAGLLPRTLGLGVESQDIGDSELGGRMRADVETCWRPM